MSTRKNICTSGKHFVDASGRTVILRGVNATGDAKMPPFRGMDGPQDFAPLREWGFNTLRLLFIWEAFEPQAGSYDLAYLDYYEQMVAWAAAEQLHVIVDFHQDAFSRYALGGCGEGFPEWAIAAELPRHTPKNDARCEKWGLMASLFTASKKANQRVWQRFHENAQNARTRYALMTAKVAERLANHANVIGYELINEPWGSNEQLTALHAEVEQAIRAHDPHSIMFVAPQCLYSSGFAKSRLPKPAFGNCAFAPHYYDAGVILGKRWWGVKPHWLLRNLQWTAKQWQVPLLLGEYGAPANTTRGTAYMHALHDWLDQEQASGTQWCYTPHWQADTRDGWNREDLSIVNANRELRDNVVLRPYPSHTAGKALEFISKDGGSFSYRWQQKAALGATHIYLPPQLRARTWTVEADSAMQAQVERQEEYLLCSAQHDGVINLRME